MQPITKTRLALLCTAVFTAGLLTGVAADRFYIKRHFPQFMRQQFGRDFARGKGFPHPELESADERKARDRRMREKLLDRMTRGLDLTRDQREKIDTILVNHKKGFDEKRSDCEKLMRSAMEETDRAILKLLNEKQRKKFREVMPPPPPGLGHPGHPGPPPPPPPQ